MTTFSSPTAKNLANNMEKRTPRNHILHLFFYLFSLMILTTKMAAAQKIISIKVGVVLDMDDYGKMTLDCITMALSDFYATHNHYKTRLVLTNRDSKGDVIGAAAAALDLLKNVQVQAIIGPTYSVQANFLIALGHKAQVPIITFSATSPALSSIQSPYFIRSTINDSSQVDAIVSIVQAFGWREVVPIYEDNEFGEGILPFLNDALEKVNVRLPYRSVMPPLATDDQIVAELYKLMTMQTRVFIVHMLSPLASRLLPLLSFGRGEGRKQLGQVCADHMVLGGAYTNSKLYSQSCIYVNSSEAEQMDEFLSKGSGNGGIAAAFHEIPYNRLFLGRYCSKYTTVGPTYKADGFGFVFPIGSPLVPDVSRAILNVTEGQKMMDIENTWLGDKTKCPDSDAIYPFKSLGLASFWGLFLIAGVAGTAAFIIYVIRFLRENRSLIERSAPESTMWSKILELLQKFDNKDLRSHTFKKYKQSERDDDNYDDCIGSVMQSPHETYQQSPSSFSLASPRTNGLPSPVFSIPPAHNINFQQDQGLSAEYAATSQIGESVEMINQEIANLNANERITSMQAH